MHVPARLLDVRLLGKHQLAALFATAVDFAIMIALVQLAGLPPPLAAFAGAACGGVTNFTLGRAWAFRGVHTGTLGAQAARYAVVSLGGALLNAATLALMLEVSPFPYMLARIAVSGAVSVAYAFPMQTLTAFRARALCAAVR
jgi:putative flippase GtrA